MICSYSSSIAIKGGVFFNDSAPTPSGIRDRQGQREQKTEPGSAESSCVLPYPHHTSAFWKGGAPVPGLLFPSPAEPLPSPRQQQMVPGLPLPTLLGGANLSPGRQRADEKRSSWLAKPTLPHPASSSRPPHTRLPHSSDHPSLPLTGSALRSPNSSSPSAPFPTPSRSSPPAALTRAGVFAYLHMQIITFAYGAPQGCLRESRLAVCPPFSLGTCRKGLGQGPRGWG